MKQILKTLFFLSLVLTFFSCENNVNEPLQNTTNIQPYVLKNGRLCFQNKNTFKDFFNKYKEASDEKLNSFFMPLYEKGFYSLRPIVTESNEKFIYDHYSALTPKANHNTSKEITEEYADYMDQLEDIIGDDVFAAFLNEKAEIQIEDIVYKYTDVGLFFAKEDKTDVLKNYLELKNISEDMKIETEDNAKLSIKNEFPQNGEVTVNSDISYFKIAPIDSGDGGGGGGSSGGYTPTPSAPTSDPSYLSFLNNLQYCDQVGGLWNFFSNLFGDNNVCIDRYENRRRVKTKSFNYNYFVVYHLGVKVHHQYRGWTGFWRSEDADEIRLVVEAAQFEYDTDKLLNNTMINNHTLERAYYINNEKILYQPNSLTFNNQWGNPIISYTNLNSLPAVFQDDLTFEFFGTGWDWLDSQIQNGIDSNLNAKKLNDYFYHELYSTVQSQLQSASSNLSVPSNRTFITKFPENGKFIIQKSQTSIGYGTDVKQSTYDWGAEISLNLSQNDNNSWNISGGAGNQLIRPANFRVKMIGAVLKNGGWHGSKMNVGID